MTDRRQRAIERRLRRLCGATPEHAERVNNDMMSRDDLYTTCQRCGRRRTGTLEQLQQPCGCE